MHINRKNIAALFTIFILVFPQNLVFASEGDQATSVENEAEQIEEKNIDKYIEKEIENEKDEDTEKQQEEVNSGEQEEDLKESVDTEEESENEVEQIEEEDIDKHPEIEAEEENDESKENQREEVNSSEQKQEKDSKKNTVTEEEVVNEVKSKTQSDAKFTIGDKGQHVVELKMKLTSLGFGSFPKNPSLNYGPVTAGVVEEFQTAYGLKATGNADQATLDKIEEILNSKYSPGQSGEHVRELKKKLTQLGFGNFPSNPSTVYGSVTAGVVSEFQEHYNLRVTGIADEHTLNKIEEILNPPYKDGHRGLHIVQLKKDLTALGFGSFPKNPSLNYGPVTANVVREFQQFYNLKVDGVAGKETLQMIKNIIENPYENGTEGKHVIQLKKNLTAIGFGNFPSNPSQTYGKVTKGVVKEFQIYYNLKNQTGSATAETIQKMQEVMNSPYQRGKRGPHVIELKKDLTELGFGNFPSNPSESYGSVTEGVVLEFQKAYGLIENGIADSVTLAKIEELLNAQRYTEYNLTIKKAIEIQMNQMAQTDKGEYAWVSKSYIDSNNRVTASALNVRTQPTTSNEMSNRILGTLSKGTKVEIIDQKGNWYAIKYNNSSWVHAVREDVRYYLNPNNFINDNRQKFQFLDLSKPSGASRSVLNNYLKDRDVLANQGQAFIDAARKHGVNDIYLISHSVLETGHGTSTLAKGVEVGVNKDGKPVLVTKSNRKSLKNIKTVYNMYGIGAVDSNPLGGGAIHAYNEGWDTVEKAIIGGAKFIGNSYIKNGQNTLYKMRWNPKMNEGMAWKQYATDIGWASKQVHTMYNLYQEIGHNNPILDIPVYK